MRFTQVLLPSAAALLACFQMSAQAVISAHSGVVHFSEGSVFLDDQPLDHKFATFPNIKEGSTLRTEKGRAEVLLTPGVFLRVDENSAIRMRSNALTDTRVDFLGGSAIIDSLDALADNHVAIFYKDTEVRFPKQGVYRLDYEPGTLQAYSGEAAVTHDGKTSNVDESHLFFFTLDLDTKKLTDGTDDEFYDWARERSNDISAENQLAAQNSGEVGDADGGDPNALAANPNFGLPNSGIPNTGIPNAGIPGYSIPGYDYPMSSALINPFGPYSGGWGYYPYSAFPLIVIARPYGYRNGHSPWVHGSSTTNPWPHRPWPTSTTSSGYRPTWNGTSLGISNVPSMRYVVPPPLSSTVGRPGYVPHPTYVPHSTYAPHPAVAPSAVHAIGHR